MIPVETDPFNTTAPMALECCCFCRKPSNSWTKLPNRTGGDQVACCDSCAKRAHPEDVPSKRVWMRREAIAAPTMMTEHGIGPPRIDQVATYPPKER